MKEIQAGENNILKKYEGWFKGEEAEDALHCMLSFLPIRDVVYLQRAIGKRHMAVKRFLINEDLNFVFKKVPGPWIPIMLFSVEEYALKSSPELAVFYNLFSVMLLEYNNTIENIIGKYIKEYDFVEISNYYYNHQSENLLKDRINCEDILSCEHHSHRSTFLMAWNKKKKFCEPEQDRNIPLSALTAEIVRQSSLFRYLYNEDRSQETLDNLQLYYEPYYGALLKDETEKYIPALKLNPIVIKRRIKYLRESGKMDGKKYRSYCEVIRKFSLYVSDDEDLHSKTIKQTKTILEKKSKIVRKYLAPVCKWEFIGRKMDLLIFPVHFIALILLLALDLIRIILYYVTFSWVCSSGYSEFEHFYFSKDYINTFFYRKNRINPEYEEKIVEYEEEKVITKEIFVPVYKTDSFNLEERYALKHKKENLLAYLEQADRGATYRLYT